MNSLSNASTTPGADMVMDVSLVSTADAMRRYRAVVEGIVETRKKLEICRAMKNEAERALAEADKSLAFNATNLADAEEELVAIQSCFLG